MTDGESSERQIGAFYTKSGNIYLVELRDSNPERRYIKRGEEVYEILGSLALSERSMRVARDCSKVELDGEWVSDLEGLREGLDPSLYIKASVLAREVDSEGNDLDPQRPPHFLMTSEITAISLKV